MKALSPPTHPADELLETLLTISLTGVILFEPVYATDGTCIIDLAYVRLNPVAQQKLQLPEYPAQTFLTLYPHAVETGIFAFYRDTFLSGKAGRLDLNYSHDGLDNYFHLSAKPAGRLLVVSFDDTAHQPRTAVEVALRESQAREKAARAEVEAQGQKLRALLEQSPVGIGLFQGQDQVVTLANQKICEMWGHPVERVLNRPLLEGVPELRGQGFDELIREVFTTGIPYTGQEVAAQLPRDGQLETSYYNFVYQPLRDEHGLISGVMNVVVEVTEQVLARKQVERSARQVQALNEELAAANEELKATNEDLVAAKRELEDLNHYLEQRVTDRTHALQLARQDAERQRCLLHDLFMEAPAPIAILEGEELVYQLVNPAYQRSFPGRELLHKPLLEALPEWGGTPMSAIFRHVYQTGETFEAREMPLLLARHQGGPLEETYWTFTCQARRNGKGVVDGVLVFAYEVTDQVLARRRIEESARQVAASNLQLESANGQLLRINSDLDTFVYTASHDLKAPILNMEGLLNALEKQLPPEVLQKEVAGRLYRLLYTSVNRFKATIGDLTEVARIGKESSEDVAPIEVGVVLKEVLDDLEPQRQEAGAQLAVELACPPILFSRKNLKSVLYNLLSNAIKYRSPEREPRIRVTCRSQGDYYVLTVGDNGLGMDMRQEAKIFALFKRLHTHVEGTGIGLYIVRKMVENAGGKIEVTSQVGIGSTFRVYFKQ